MSVSTTNSTSISMGKEAGGRQALKMQAEGIEMDAGAKDLWPYFSQESRYALSPANTIATSPHH